MSNGTIYDVNVFSFRDMLSWAEQGDSFSKTALMQVSNRINDPKHKTECEMCKRELSSKYPPVALVFLSHNEGNDSWVINLSKEVRILLICWLCTRTPEPDFTRILYEALKKVLGEGARVLDVHPTATGHA